MSSTYVSGYYYSQYTAVTDYLKYLIQKHGTIEAAAASLNVAASDILACLEGDRKTHYKMLWEATPELLPLLFGPGVNEVIQKQDENYIPLFIDRCKRSCTDAVRDSLGIPIYKRGVCFACPYLRKEREKVRSGFTPG